MSKPAPRGTSSPRRVTAWRLLAAFLLAVMAVPSLFLHAHVAFVEHHSRVHQAADASTDHDHAENSHEHGPDHSPDDHARDLQLKYTHRRVGSVAPVVAALPSSGGWVLRVPVLLERFGGTSPAAQGARPAVTPWPRGPPAAV